MPLRLWFSVLVLVGCAAAPPASAMDWLTPHLESQRNSNLLRHQQSLQKHDQQPKAAAGAKRSSLAKRQATWQQSKVEYRRRLLRDGQPSADRWLDNLARQDR